MSSDLTFSKKLETDIVSIINDLANKLKTPDLVEGAVLDKKNVTLLGRVHPWDPLTLSHGFPGSILFFSEMNKAYPGEGWDYVAHQHISYVTPYLEQGFRSVSLFGGVTGLAFAVHSASNKGQRYKNYLSKLDKVIIEETYNQLENEKFRKGLGASPAFYDVIQGLAGVGRYCLERQSYSHLFNKVLKEILSSFINMSRPIVSGTKKIPGWYISRENQFLNKDKIKYPHGNFNTGLAHGILGPLSLMALCILKGIEVKHQRETIKYISDWLIEQMKYDSTGYPVWPHRVSLEELLEEKSNAFDKREGWCYGNPGVARVLYLAGAALNHSDYKQVSMGGFLGIIDRGLENTELESPTFCHGKAGLLQILIRMKSDTRDENLDQLINELAAELTQQYNYSAPLGFEDLEISEGNINKITKAGLLEGSTGAGLSLLSLLFEKECEWDKTFLIN
ncbi:lanthionine synthetase C family protein [Alteribacillus sp. HJP-4]|uniref:lanthionine synthetase C family protein n=1 Tax=Alteribacillus sp. HJP-4 TaxID=2775394 RepID=UPI0035CCCD4F